MIVQIPRGIDSHDLTLPKQGIRSQNIGPGDGLSAHSPPCIENDETIRTRRLIKDQAKGIQVDIWKLPEL